MKVLGDGELMPRQSVVAIGKFDGVHLGHRELIAQARLRADELSLPLVVVTFDRNPLSVLRPDECPVQLSSLEQRLERFEAVGVDFVRVLHFDEALASIPAEAFIDQFLVSDLGVRWLVVGADFRFGHRGIGDAALLQLLGEAKGFRVTVLEDVLGTSQQRVSSTAIRDALNRGDVAEANALLGQPHCLRGEVVHGDKRGRELGFPTANLGGALAGFVPEDGIYAAWACVAGNPELQRVPAAVSIGTNPTFPGDRSRRVEAFLIGESGEPKAVGDLYGSVLSLELIARLRPTVAFDSLSDLLAQMHADVADVRSVLGQ